MIKQSDDIKDLLELISTQERFSYSDLVNLMGKTRQLIEKGKLQDKYQTLNLYCNWCAHVVLFTSTKGYRILERIADAFLDDAKPNKTTHTNDRMCEIISLKELRRDFIALYTAYSIPIFLFNKKQVWKDICGMLLKELLAKPIEFPSPMKPKVNKIYDSIIAKTKGTNLAPSKLYLSNDKDFGLCWNVEVFPKPVTIKGPLKFTETDADFV